MGILEKESKKRAQKENVQKIILSTIKGAGILSVALISPSVVGAFGKLGVIRSGNHWVKRSVNRLVERGLLKFEKTEKAVIIAVSLFSTAVCIQIKSTPRLETAKPFWAKTGTVNANKTILANNPEILFIVFYPLYYLL